MTRRKGRRQSGWTIFAIPALLAMASMAGLISGLLGDGAYDAIAAVGLGLPILCVLAVLLRPSAD